MFAAEVQGDLKTHIRIMKKNVARSGIRDDGFILQLQRAKQDLYNAQKFYIGDYQELQKIFKPKDSLTLRHYAKMPFKLCWFAYQLAGQERGLLCSVEQEDLLFVRLFFRNEATGGPYHWEISLFAFYASVFQDIRSHPEILPLLSDSDLARENRMDYAPTLLISQKDAKKLGPDFLSDMYQSGKEDLSVLFGTLILLNCKNIETKNSLPSKKERLKAKSRKLPIYSFRHLFVSVPASRAKKSCPEGKKGGGANRLHLCRGHFKEYTSDAPLFGKHKGLYWWQPCIKGCNKQGVLMKDYNLKPDGESKNA